MQGHRAVASYGPISVTPRQERVPLDRGSVAGRSMLDRQTIHVHDILNTPVSEYPRARELAQRHGNRTVLSTPLLRRGVPIGAILLRRIEARPFTERQIKLLETFADQAVIAIENARLFQELTVKSTELESSNSELREALEQQTATSEILGVIASSPTDIQPVLDAVAENAARLCGATDAQINRVEGEFLRRVASYGSMATPDEGKCFQPSHVGGRAIIDRQTIHIHDIQSGFDTEFPGSKDTITNCTGVRTISWLRHCCERAIAIGNVVIRRTEVRPFTEKQIALLKTFADQAVIAIENVRLFQELKRSAVRAADCHERNSGRDCQFANGPGAGLKNHHRACHAGVRRRGRSVAVGGWKRPALGSSLRINTPRSGRTSYQPEVTAGASRGGSGYYSS